MKYLFMLLYSTSLFASSIGVEVGQTTAVFNRFAIPNTDQDRISLPVEDSLTSYRLTGLYELESGNRLYFLIAPLSTSYSFSANNDFEFDNEKFSAGEETKVDYKFNSYRIGYLWNWSNSYLDFWGGIVGQIRDAQIKVTQGSLSKSFDNIGFVPLAAFGFEYKINQALSVYSHTDALSASQGSAYDSQLEIRINIANTSFSLGKRILGGGADNDNVYNFAQFDTYFTGIIYNY